MTDDLQAPAESNLQIIHDPDAPVQDVATPHPDLIMAIVSTALTVAEGQENQELEALYLTAKEFIKQQRDRSRSIDFTPALFAYYIESYRALRLYKNKQLEDPQTLNLVRLHNDAALSVFDLYARRPFDVTVRKMLLIATRALHKVSIAYNTIHSEDRPMRELIGDLSNIALLSETIRDYVRGTRRERNYPYIAWLKTFFEQVVETPDLNFMADNPTLSDVLFQVTHRAKTVTVPQV